MEDEVKSYNKHLIKVFEWNEMMFLKLKKQNLNSSVIRGINFKTTHR